MSRSGIVLAAGLSTRFGGSKLTQPLGDLTVLGKAVSSLLAVCDKVYVVTGAHEDEVRKALAVFPDVIRIHNEQYEKGMFSSVLAGIHAAPEEDNLLILPGDIPLVRSETCRLIADTEPDWVCVPVHDGHRGHPVYIPAHAAARLRQTDLSWTLRDFLLEEGMLEIPVDDPGVLRDVDTPEEYREIRKDSLP